MATAQWRAKRCQRRQRGRDDLDLCIAPLPAAGLGLVPHGLLRHGSEALAQGYDIVPLAELRQYVPRPSGRPRAVLGFDGGDVHTTGLQAPLLVSRGLSAACLFTTAPGAPVASGEHLQEYRWDAPEHLLETLPSVGLVPRSDGRRVPIRGRSDAGRAAASTSMNRLLARCHPSVARRAATRRRRLVRVPTCTSRTGHLEASGRCSGRAASNAAQTARAPVHSARTQRPYTAPGTLRRDAAAAASAGYERAVVHVPGPVVGSQPQVPSRVTVGWEVPEALMSQRKDWDDRWRL